MTSDSDHPDSPLDGAGEAASDVATDASLDAARESFIALWSQMGSQWGIPRTMAQVHALLYIVGTPLSADEVVERLGISRGNASMTLRGLVEWGLVHRVHRRGERKEFFEAEQDVWKILRTVLAERKRREVDPLLVQLEACRRTETPPAGRRVDRDASEQAAEVRGHNERVEAMLGLVGMIDAITDRLLKEDPAALRSAAKLLEKAS